MNLLGAIKFVLLIPALATYRKLMNTDVGKCLQLDMNQALREKDEHKVTIKQFCHLMSSRKNFRNIFYYRIRKCRLVVNFTSCFFPPIEGIEIGSAAEASSSYAGRGESINGGLRAIHNSGCVIAPWEAGEKLTVYQGVTIGYSPGSQAENGRLTPIIGNNVCIYANAVVAGAITIGNNVRIAAGSVVLRNVPDNCTVAGNPARIVIKDGVKCNIKL